MAFGECFSEWVIPCTAAVLDTLLVALQLPDAFNGLITIVIRRHIAKGNALLLCSSDAVSVLFIAFNAGRSLLYDLVHVTPCVSLRWRGQI